jgi:hypothetical protein
MPAAAGAAAAGAEAGEEHLWTAIGVVCCILYRVVVRSRACSACRLHNTARCEGQFLIEDCCC